MTLGALGGDIGLQHAHAGGKSVIEGISQCAPGQKRGQRIDLHQSDANIRQARCRTEARRANTCAQIHHMALCAIGQGGCQIDRIKAGTVETLCGLLDGDKPAQKGITCGGNAFRQLKGGKARGRRDGGKRDLARHVRIFLPVSAHGQDRHHASGGGRR